MINEIREKMNEAGEKQRQFMVSLRKKITDAALGTNNIDRVFRDKIDDYILVDEMPLPIQVGKYTIWIGTFTLETQHKFFQEYGKLLANRMANIVNFDLLADGLKLFKALHSEKNLYKNLLKVIKKTVLNEQEYWLNLRGDPKVKIKLPKCPISYFKRNITIEKLIQICALVYLYNFDAEKKNLQVITKAIGLRDMETYIYGWLANCTGLTGKFLLSQLRNVSYWEDENTRQEIPLGGK